ncbi:hypothetical protein SAMN06297144_3335 [Sphingomonas guangdongensis]|uniref:Uncharacterized protein n=1 Tax=Sphingomonas guangdongensis TaxID=1141890 RepID=A0A285R258_9SPHN|nr:hypothetical protein [Sphingomonas guangdongensis]SOB88190.1 hypothetical protein SAMN06297144_3335 [Sphingomonas guangdongensis]
MKTFTLMIAGLGIATAAIPAVASAQSWQSINARQANLDRRIDVGVRNGSLSRVEARNLRNDFRQLTRLEARYRQGGLSIGERRDLDRRFDQLSQRIRYERRDRNRR